MFMMIALMMSCKSGGETSPFEGDQAGECSDGADNDRDGQFDCEDPDCAASPDCAEAGTTTETDEAETGTPTTVGLGTDSGTVTGTSGTADTSTYTTEEVLPIAICDADPNNVSVGTPVNWQGSNSFDPSGHPLTHYQWTLSSTAYGSTATLQAPNQATCPFAPDTPGTYTTDLVVKTDDGRTSLPCEATLEVSAPSDLRILLTWDRAGDDLDLHLLQPAGSPWTTGDCYYLDCVGRSLRWGDPSSTADDPTLSADDVTGTGPEEIHIPAADNGQYRAWVNDNPSHQDNTADNATVTVYFAGNLIWTGTKALTGENASECFATIDTSTGTAWPCAGAP